MFDVATIAYVADTRGLDRASDSMRRVDQQATRTERAARLLGRALAAIGAGFSLRAAIREFTQLEDRVSEVITLFDRTQLGDLGFTATSRQIQRELEVLSAQAGEAGEVLSQGLFDIVSSGTTDQAQALNVLREATELARAGATETSVAVDGITSLLNAYSISADEAARVSESLFVAQRFGRTTVEELSTAIGRVAPLAEALGISFEELLAAQAGVTSVGINQREAVSGLRAALSNILKPSEDAARVAEQLGIQFNASALEAQGLTGFLDQIVQRTGGSVDALSSLFGSVEGVNAVLGLTGGGAGAYADALESLSDETLRAQQFQDALSGRLETNATRFERLSQAVSGLLSSFGTGFTDSFLGEFLDEITPTEETLRELLTLSQTLGSALGTAFRIIADAARVALDVLELIGPALLVIGGRNVIARLGATALSLGGIRTAAAAALGQLRILALTNPFTALAAGVAVAGTALFRFSDQISVTQDGAVSLQDVFRQGFSEVGQIAHTVGNVLRVAFLGNFEDIGIEADSLTARLGLVFRNIVETAADRINTLIGVFRGAYAAVEEVWGQFPAFLGDVAVTAVNAALDGVQNFVRASLVALSNLPGFGRVFGELQELTFERPNFQFENPFEGTAGDVAGAFTREFNAATQDGGVVGALFDGLVERTVAAQAATEEIEQTVQSTAASYEELAEVAGSSIQLISDEQRQLVDELDRSIEQNEVFIRDIGLRSQAIQDSIRVQELEKEGTLDARIAIEELRLQRELEAIQLERSIRLKELNAQLDQATGTQATRLRRQIVQLETAYDNLSDAATAQSRAAIQGIRDIASEANSLRSVFDNLLGNIFDGSQSFRDIGRNFLNDLRGSFLAPFREDLQGAINSLFKDGNIELDGFLGNLADGAKDVFDDLNLGGFFENLKEGVESIFGGISLTGGDVGIPGLAAIFEAGSSISEALGGNSTIGGLFGAIPGIAAGLFESSQRLQGFFNSSNGQVNLARADTRSGVGTEAAEQIASGINDILQSINATVTDQLDFSVLFKPEDNFLSIRFGGNNFRDFEADEIAEALAFATSEILSDPALSRGVSDELRAQLASGSIETLDELEDLLSADFDRIQGAFSPFLDQLNQFAGELSRQPEILERASAGIRSFLDELNFNEFSNLSQVQQLELARNQFNQLFARAQGGDVEAIQGLTGAADRLLGLSRDVNASNADFQSDRQSVVDALTQVEGITSTSQDRALAQLNELQQLRELIAGGINVNNIGDITTFLSNFGIGSTASNGTIFAANGSTQSFVEAALLALNQSAQSAGFVAPTPTTGQPGFDGRAFNGITADQFNELINLNRQILRQAVRTVSNTSETNDGLEAVNESLTETSAPPPVNPTTIPGTIVRAGTFI